MVAQRGSRPARVTPRSSVGGARMATPLTPIEFARCACRVYADREAVVAGPRRRILAFSKRKVTMDEMVWIARVSKLAEGIPIAAQVEGVELVVLKCKGNIA